MKKNTMLRQRTRFGAVLTLLLGIGVAQANTYTVTSTTEDATPAACSGSALSFTCTTLRDAINAANNDGNVDTINFSVSGTVPLGSTLPSITGTLTIDGTSQSITISGSSYRVLINSGMLTFKALTIAASNCSLCTGAGIYNFGGTLAVINSTFLSNSAADGGAIAAELGTLTVINSTFTNNSAGTNGYGGAIFSPAQTTVTNSTFYGN